MVLSWHPPRRPVDPAGSVGEVVAGEHAAGPEHAGDLRQAPRLAPPGLANVLQDPHRCDRVERTVGVWELDRLAFVPAQEWVIAVRKPAEKRPVEKRIARRAVPGTLKVI